MGHGDGGTGLSHARTVGTRQRHPVCGDAPVSLALWASAQLQRHVADRIWGVPIVIDRLSVADEQKTD